MNRHSVRNDKAKIMFGIMGLILVPTLVYRFLPMDSNNTAVQVGMVVLLFCSAPIGALVSGTIGWAIETRLLPWIEKSAMNSTDSQGPRHWGMW